MCEWGAVELCAVTVPAVLSHTGKRRSTVKPVDRCLASLVRALNALDVITVSCCCGHGRQPAEILLEDGTALVRLTDGHWWWSVPGRELNAADRARVFDRVLCPVPAAWKVALAESEETT